MLDVFLTLHSVRQEQGLTLVHPFDDPLVMAGQGTIGLEIIEQVQNATRVVVGVGGGGLIGGIAAAIKSLRPEVEVIGVEPVGAAAMTESLRAGSAMCLAQVDTIADGLGAPYVSNATFAVASDYVDRVVLLTDDEIAGAVRRILTECKVLVEPAGAAAVAAVLSGKVPGSPGDGVVCVLSGGNIARERLMTLL